MGAKSAHHTICYGQGPYSKGSTCVFFASVLVYLDDN